MEISLNSSLKKIGHYVQNAFRRSALDAWNIGRAFRIAKPRRWTSFA
jgi:hypothetical protein